MFRLELDDDLAIAIRERHDAPAFAALIDANRAHLARWFAWAPTADRAAALAWADAGLDQFRRGDGWHATLLERDERVGSVGLHYLDRTGGVTEIGYWLAESAQGRGIMTRALRGLIAHFFVGHGLSKVVIGVSPGNARSAALPVRLGFTHEGRIRGVHEEPGGARGDLDLYGLLRDEWDGADAVMQVPPRFALARDGDVRVALLEREDADALAALVSANAEHLDPWFPWVVGSSPATVRTFIEERALPAFAAGLGFEAGIWLGDRLAGTVGVHDVDARAGRGQIGYWLAREHEGKGVVSTAVRRVLERQFVDIGLRRLEIRAGAANARSRAVAERLGFTQEATLRRAQWNGREAVDQVVYGLLREEWRPAAP